MAIFRSRRFSIRSRFFPSIASYPTSRTDGTNRQKSKDAPFLYREIFSDILWALVRNHVSWRKEIKGKIQSKISLLRNESNARLREIDKDLGETFKERSEETVIVPPNVAWIFSDILVLFEFLIYYTITRSRFSPVAAHRRVAFFSNNELKEKKKKRKKTYCGVFMVLWLLLLLLL